MSKNTERRVGTVSRGIRCPIIRQGDDLGEIVVNSVLEAAKYEGFSLRAACHRRDRVHRSALQGNYCKENIAADVRAKLGGGTVSDLPILSCNRLAICLRGIAKGAKKIVLMLSYPSMKSERTGQPDKIDAAGVNPYSDVLTLKIRAFSASTHMSSPVDYVQHYADLTEILRSRVRSSLPISPAILPMHYVPNW